MKKVLITGKNSYIGNSVESWLMKEPENYIVHSIDMKDGSWKLKDFSSYDVVFHVAGIAHIKETKKNESLYYKVNRDLAFEAAKKSKSEGVNQFVFLSSMSVYGIDEGVIDNKTLTLPKTAYGKSKIEAEYLISDLQDHNFQVSIIRPPMVYGKGCKGNYSKLSKLVLRTHIFPKINNKRSMIYIGNLSEFVKIIIDNQYEGLFFPQNEKFVSTSEMVELIVKSHGEKIKFVYILNPILNFLNIGIINKIFGDLIYDLSMSDINIKYQVFNFEESILRTELN